MLIRFVLQSRPKKSRHFAPLKSNSCEVELPPLVRFDQEDEDDEENDDYDEDELWSMIRSQSDRSFLVYA
jgi:hypothetical protein